MIPFHHLVWNKDDLESVNENAQDNRGLKVREDVARALATTGGTKWTKFQPSASMGGESVGIEPGQRES